uniref:Uncharacterized protein n=1 Tax=Guillardia theta TaxID=55529 RepID=A0A7S4NR47_GUITH
MADPQGISEEMSTLPAPDASGNAYGTFKKDGRTSDDAMANETQSSVRDDNGDDEWSKIRQEYGKQSHGRFSGLFSFFQRLPVHWSVLLVALAAVLALCLFLIFGLSQPAKKSPPLAMHHAKSALNKFTVKRAAAPSAPSTTATPNGKAAASSSAAEAKQGGLTEQQEAIMNKRKEAQAEAAKKRLEKMQRREEEKKEVQELLTVRPTDSPEVRNYIQRAEQQQTNVAFQRERVTVAENNLVPLQQAVNQRQAAYDAENQQYLSWKKRMDQDKEELNGIVNSRQEIDKRLAQLKVLGRREKDNMPGMRQKILSAEKKQGVALQQSDRFSKLARQASVQLQETIRAEKDDEEEIARQKMYIQRQQQAAKDGMVQSQELMSRTTGLEETIARLTPVVDGLYKEYETSKNAKIQSGMVKLDEQRQAARTELNKYIRERERMEELPKTPARVKKIQDVSKKLVAAQKKLGTLYSNEESDREALKASVEAEEKKTPVYLGYVAKNKLLQTARQRLSSISTRADQIRMQAQIAEQSASEATEKTARTETTDALLKSSERRLRVKEKAFDKESSYQLENAKKWEQQANTYRKAITDAKTKLTSETVKGEEYLENIMSGHEKRNAVENRIEQEKKAFENEAMLRDADKQQLQQAEMQYDAAKAVVKNLKQQVQLAKAMAWKADMQVKESRQNQQLQNSIQYEQQQQQQVQQQVQQQQQPMTNGGNMVNYNIVGPNMANNEVQAQTQTQMAPQPAPLTASMTTTRGRKIG